MCDDLKTNQNQFLSISNKMSTIKNHVETFFEICKINNEKIQDYKIHIEKEMKYKKKINEVIINKKEKFYQNVEDINKNNLSVYSEILQNLENKKEEFNELENRLKILEFKNKNKHKIFEVQKNKIFYTKLNVNANYQYKKDKHESFPSKKENNFKHNGKSQDKNYNKEKSQNKKVLTRKDITEIFKLSMEKYLPQINELIAKKSKKIKQCKTTKKTQSKIFNEQKRYLKEDGKDPNYLKTEKLINDKSINTKKSRISLNNEKVIGKKQQRDYTHTKDHYSQESVSQQPEYQQDSNNTAFIRPNFNNNFTPFRKNFPNQHLYHTQNNFQTRDSERKNVYFQNNQLRKKLLMLRENMKLRELIKNKKSKANSEQDK